MLTKLGFYPLLVAGFIQKMVSEAAWSTFQSIRSLRTAFTNPWSLRLRSLPSCRWSLK